MDMKKFYIKCAFIFLFSALYIGRKVVPAYYYDTYNVFHWKDIRFIGAEPNKNYIKTKHILRNPQKYNAFIFGSSRVQYLPLDALPKQMDGKDLSWYNMTSSVAIPNDHVMTIETFLDGKVLPDVVVLAFDDTSLYRSPEEQKYDLMRCPYQRIVEKPFEYLLAYLSLATDDDIKKAVDAYDKEKFKAHSELFYEYGGNIFTPELTKNIDLKRYEIEQHGGYSQKDSYKDLEAVVDVCAKNGIKLILLTNPLYKNLYRVSVESGYFEFLRKVAQRCEFYNFSTLNNYTTDPRYYFEWSHYRTALGLIIEKYIFGSEKDREQIRRDAGDELFGAKVNAQNVDAVIEALEKQLKDFREPTNP